jgi:hypothetical protein
VTITVMSEAKESLEDTVDKMKFGVKKIGSKMDDADKHTKDKIDTTHSLYISTQLAQNFLNIHYLQ